MPGADCNAAASAWGRPAAAGADRTRLFVARQLLINQGPCSCSRCRARSHSRRAAPADQRGRQPEHRETVPGLPGRLQRGGCGIHRGFAQNRLQASHRPRTSSTAAINPRHGRQLNVSCRSRKQIQSGADTSLGGSSVCSSQRRNPMMNLMTCRKVIGTHRSPIAPELIDGQNGYWFRSTNKTS